MMVHMLPLSTSMEGGGGGKDGLEWVVPLVHLIPLEIPPIRLPLPSVVGQFHANNEGGCNWKNIILMT